MSAIGPDPLEAPDRYRRRVRHLKYLLDDPSLPSDQRVRGLLAAPVAGTPVVINETAGLGGLLPDRVLDTMSVPDLAVFDDRNAAHGLAWRQRHAVLAEGLLPNLTGRRGNESMSVIVATKRPHMIGLWAPQIAAQTTLDLEVVVGLHGDAFSPADRQLIETLLAGRTVKLVAVDATASLGEVLQRATERASGVLISKWDDDDLYDVDHLAQMARIWANSGAMLVGKAVDFVYLSDTDETVQRRQANRETFSPTMAGGTLTMMRADLLGIGGWPLLPTAVDLGLIDRALDHGGRAYRSFGFGYMLVRYPSPPAMTASPIHGGGLPHHGHTWDANHARMRASAVDARAGLAAPWALIDSPGVEILSQMLGLPPEPRGGPTGAGALSG